MCEVYRTEAVISMKFARNTVYSTLQCFTQDVCACRRVCVCVCKGACVCVCVCPLPLPWVRIHSAPWMVHWNTLYSPRVPTTCNSSRVGSFVPDVAPLFRLAIRALGKQSDPADTSAEMRERKHGMKTSRRKKTQGKKGENSLRVSAPAAGGRRNSRPWTSAKLHPAVSAYMGGPLVRCYSPAKTFQNTPNVCFAAGRLRHHRLVPGTTTRRRARPGEKRVCLITD